MKSARLNPVPCALAIATRDGSALQAASANAEAGSSKAARSDASAGLERAKAPKNRVERRASMDATLVRSRRRRKLVRQRARES
jgi:hypothetical protein